MTDVGTRTPVSPSRGHESCLSDTICELNEDSCSIGEVQVKPTAYIKGLIEGTEVAILIDTGSSVSLISEDFRMSNSALRKRVLHKHYMLARTVNGQLLDTLGTLTLTVRMGCEHWEHIVHVVRGATQTVLLGWDFLSQHHAILNTGDSILMLRGIEIPLLQTADLIPECCNISMSADVTVPALSEMIVPVRVEAPNIAGPTPDAFLGYLEPDPRDSTQLVIARTVTPVTDGCTVARLLNPTDRDLKLHQGSHLGVFYHVKDEDLIGHSTGPPVDCNATTFLPDVSRGESPLSGEQKKRLYDLLDKHQGIFRPGRGNVGQSGLIKHHIRTGEQAPIKQRAYRASPDKRQEIDRQVATLLEDGIIEESCSPWSSPVVLVKKKNNSWRFCVDYRKLNSVTIKDSHPLPRVDDTLDALSGSTWFSTLDFSDGYWQVGVAEEDREKTAFSTGRSLYQFRSMPMGLTNAPATFQRFMELVLRGLPWHICMVYLDDILIYSQSFDDHLSHLDEVFSRIGSAGLKLNAKKCHLACDHVVFLGHVVSQEGLRPDPRNTERVRLWPTPRSATEVRAFIGLCSYYRRFVKDFAHHAAPLHRLTGKDVPFQWTGDCQASFDHLRITLSTEPVIRMPNFSHPFRLYTDASQTAVGAVLAQDINGTERVVAYASHALTAAERRWSTYDRELWAIVWAVRQFRQYLGATSFTIITDHKPLLGLRHIPIDNDRTGRRSRWALELDPYDWVVVHKSGAKHNNADALSRRPCVEDGSPDGGHSHDHMDVAVQTDFTHGPEVVCSLTSPIQSPSPADAGGITTEDLQTSADQTLLYTLAHDGANVRQLQQEDADIGTVLSWLRDPTQRPARWRLKGASRALKHLWTEFHRLTLINGLLCRVIHTPKTGATTPQIVVPSALVHELLTHLHGGPLSAHLAFDRVLDRARKVCYWPTMYKDIHQWCEQCYACQRRKSPVPKHRAPMGGSLASKPFERVAADILELPHTSCGNRYVLVVEDYFTKYVNLYALPDQKATTVATCLFKEYVMEHGIPETLHSDQGRQFESDLVKGMCQMLGVRKTRTTPYNPKSDGMVERFNRTLIDQLAKTLLSCAGEWDGFLKQIAFAYNTSVHSSTGYTPYFLTHGREARVPADVLLGPLTQGNPLRGPPGEFAASLVVSLNTAFSQAKEHNASAHERQKMHYDDRMRHKPYEVGDLVWLNDPTESRLKLAPHWKGPFQIQRRMDLPGEVGVTYQLCSPFGDDQVRQTVHYDRMRPYTLPVALPASGVPAAVQPATPETGDLPRGSTGPAAPRLTVSEPVLVSPDISPAGGGCLSSPGQPSGRVTRAGRFSRPPRRLGDYVVD